MTGVQTCALPISLAASENRSYNTTAAEAFLSTFLSSEGASVTANSTVATFAHYKTGTVTLGTHTLITTLYGFYDAGQTLGATNNWGIGINTANNYINGSLSIGKATAPAQALDVVGTGLFSVGIITPKITSSTEAFEFAGDTADTDLTFNFTGTTNSGQFLWMEDEDYFKFMDEILMDTTQKINFKDTAIGIYSQADTFLDLFADGAVRIGNNSAGAPTTYLKIEPSGKSTFVGSGSGIPYGSFYLGYGNSGITILTPSSWTEIPATLYDGGNSSDFTFQNDNELKCNTAGKYKVDWSISFNCKQYQYVYGGVLVNEAIKLNTTAEGSGSDPDNKAPDCIGGTGIITLAVDDVINLGVLQGDGNDITVVDCNLTLTQVGG